MKDHPSREPDLAIADLRVWVHGRAIPDATDYWDGNWLRATAMCQSPGATVEVSGAILRLSEVAFLLNGCDAMRRTLSGAAQLACIEPNLKAELEIDHLGHLAVTIEITPDHMTERHQFYVVEWKARRHHSGDFLEIPVLMSGRPVRLVLGQL